MCTIVQLSTGRGLAVTLAGQSGAERTTACDSAAYSHSTTFPSSGMHSCATPRTVKVCNNVRQLYNFY